MKHEVAANARNRQRLAGFLASADREALVVACSESHDEKVREFGELAAARPAWGLKACAERVRDLRMADVSEAYQTYQKAHGLAKLAERLPTMMADMAEHACNREVVCPACEGVGEVLKKDVVAKCLRCAGKGTVVEWGDAKARDQVMNALRMGQQSAPLVAQQFLMSAGDFSVENLIKQSSKLLNGGPKLETSPEK